MDNMLPVYRTMDLELPSKEEAMSISLCAEPVAFSELGEFQFKPTFSPSIERYMSVAEIGEDVIAAMKILSEAGCTSRKRVFEILQPLGYTIPKVEQLLRKMRILWESL